MVFMFYFVLIKKPPTLLVTYCLGYKKKMHFNYNASFYVYNSINKLFNNIGLLSKFPAPIITELSGSTST